MGYELNRLMRQYGLATPTMAQYAGEVGPDVETIDEETGETITTPGTVTFDPVKQAAFDDYQDQYQFRLSNRPMYESAQFRTTPAQQQPQTYEDMFQMYLGRDPGDGERATITEVGSGPISDAQRQQFLRQYENEFADLGIRNTGNQLVSDQIGNYYGNILRNPDYVSNRTTPTNPVDPSAPFIERNPTVVNPNPPFTGTIMTTDQAYYDPDNPPVVDGEVTDNFLQFANQQKIINANLNNPLPTTGYSDAEARNIDPMALASNAQPTWANYLGRNPDVYAHANRVADAAGVLPGPDRPAFLANIAKEHFVDHGREEGRNWYNRGGEVKGYRHGGPHMDAGMAGVEDAGVQVLIETPQSVEEVTNVPTLEEITVDVASQGKTKFEELVEMLNKPMTTGYDKQLAAQQVELGQNTAAFQKMIEDMATGQSAGPSESEKWFRLAAALNESDDGSLMGSVASAAKEFAEIEKEKRTAGAKGDALKMQAAQFGITALENRMKNTAGLAKEERDEIKATRNYYRDLMAEHEKFNRDKKYDLEVIANTREYDSKKPLTAAAKTAKDMGLKRGTTEYNAFVKEYYENEQLTKKLELKAAVIKAESLTNAELTMKSKLDDTITELDQALSLLEEAAGLTDTAYGGTIWEWGKEAAAGVFASDSKEYKDTERLRNILTQSALKQLKATFGGAVSEGEREALLAVQGLDTKDAASRKNIISKAAMALYKLRAKKQKRFKEISSGEYSKRT